MNAFGRVLFLCWLAAASLLSLPLLLFHRQPLELQLGVLDLPALPLGVLLVATLWVGIGVTTLCGVFRSSARPRPRDP